MSYHFAQRCAVYRAGTPDRPRERARCQRRRQILPARQPQDRAAPASVDWPALTGSPSNLPAAWCRSMSEDDEEGEMDVVAESMDEKLGFSTGERHSKRSRKSSIRPTRRSICSTNGTPISIRPTRPRPMRWWMSSPPARAWSKSPTAIARRELRPQADTFAPVTAPE